MSSQNLSITQTGAVARITLTQPEIRNAFSDEVIAEITAAFIEVGGRADVRAVVLAAEGPAFCAGANLNWMRRMADYTRDENIADAGKLAEMLRVIYECPKPTIARVQGDVYAGGMGLVAACDMAVAVDTAGTMDCATSISMWVPTICGCEWALAVHQRGGTRRTTCWANGRPVRKLNWRASWKQVPMRWRASCGMVLMLQ